MGAQNLDLFFFFVGGGAKIEGFFLLCKWGRKIKFSFPSLWVGAQIVFFFFFVGGAQNLFFPSLQVGAQNLDLSSSLWLGAHFFFFYVDGAQIHFFTSLQVGALNLGCFFFFVVGGAKSRFIFLLCRWGRKNRGLFSSL